MNILIATVFGVSGFTIGCLFALWQIKGAERMEKDIESQHADYMEVLLSAGPSREFYKQLVYDIDHNKYGLYSDMRTALGIRGVSVPIVGGEFKENTCVCDAAV